MEKREFIDSLTKLVSNEDVLSVSREVKDLQIQFEDYILEVERQEQISKLEAQEREENFEEADWIYPLKEEFYNIYSTYQDKRKAIIEAERKEQNENLLIKRSLIARFKEIVESEENIGAAFGAHKEINEKWKTIGDVPRNNRHEIQHEYSRLLEEFFYNMRIYKEIKEYDLEKNFEAKKELISRLKDLEKNENIREVEAEIKALQNEWEDIGPTKQELWEEIKNEYWETVNKIYENIRKFYDDRREAMKENIVKKRAIIEKTGEILNNNRDSIKSWNKDTDAIIALQNEWKTIGFGPRKENDKVWKEFRAVCNQFFDQKSEFFKDIQSEFDKAVEEKQKLIEKVNSIKDSTDWGNTTKQIIDIQKQWKKIGSAGQKNEQKLWKQFRGACDDFFNAKDTFFAEKEKESEANLIEKEALINELNALKLPEDKKEAIKQLKDYSEKFSQIGYVPKNKKDEVYQAYKTALNKHYESLDVKGVDKEKIMFEAHIDTLKGSGNSAELLRKEKDHIRREIDAVKKDILHLENNMGFFSSSKGTNPLLAQAEKNIKKEKDKLQALVAKLKMIPNE